MTSSFAESHEGTRPRHLATRGAAIIEMLIHRGCIVRDQKIP